MALIEKLQEIKIKIAPKIYPTKLMQLFAEDTEVEYLDLRNIDTSKCNQISNLFSGCTNLKRVNMSSWDTTNIQSIAAWFSGCTSLEEVDLSNFNTKRFTTFRNWFYGCTSLKEISLDITNATILNYVFKNCTSLVKIDFSGTENVKTNLDLSTTGLDRDGLLNMLDTLPIVTTTPTFTIGEEKMALLTEEEIALFTEKGYTLA